MKNVLKLCRTIVKAESVSLAKKSVNESERARTIFKNKFSKLWKSIMRWDLMSCEDDCVHVARPHYGTFGTAGPHE